jgi:hypothetical protein
VQNQHLATPEGASGPAADFLHNLPSLPSFYESGNLEYYARMPEDWWVASTDVINSTQAIDQGRYREVNMMGAATIIGLLNAVAPDALPFAFGGDGAMVCLPAAYKHKAQAVLNQLQRMSQTAMDLDLRIDLRPIKTLPNASSFWISKFNLSQDATQYSFLGRGVGEVDELLKSDIDPSFERPDPEPDFEANFAGLECRWKPIKSPTGETLTVLVEPVGELEDQLQILSDLLSLYRDILTESEDSKPLRKSALHMNWNPLRLLRENTIVSELGQKGDRWSRWLDAQWRTMIGSFLMGNEVQTQETDWGIYKNDLIAHSDYRKVDGLLRFVASITAEQKKELLEELAIRHQNGLIRYGYHSSDSAVVTCMISRYHKAHLHFVDGSDGGYAEAARMLKKQSKP